MDPRCPQTAFSPRTHKQRWRTVATHTPDHHQWRQFAHCGLPPCQLCAEARRRRCIRRPFPVVMFHSAQSTFAVHQAQAACDHLLRGLDGSTAGGQIAQAQLRSVASPCASAWLKALPAASSLNLSDSEFRAALRRRLGLPTLPGGAPTITCFAARPWLPQTWSTPTRGPPLMRLMNGHDIQLCHGNLRTAYDQRIRLSLLP
jgi:hypothetical protein